MRFGSLFSGIGGMDLGLERAGMECAWQVEIDDFCRKVLTKHWPLVPKYNDVTECGRHNLERVDVIAGGFPCQDVSLGASDRRLGIDNGLRSGLWREMCRIVGELRPRFTLVENVPGLLTRGGLSRVVGDLTDLGYDSEWETVSACFCGASHMRRRVFVVSYPNNVGLKRSQWGLQENSTRRTIDAPIFFTPSRGTWDDLPTPHICRGSDGIANRVHRLRGLGNAVVPQVAEWIGKRITDAANQ